MIKSKNQGYKSALEFPKRQPAESTRWETVRQFEVSRKSSFKHEQEKQKFFEYSVLES